MTERPFPIGSRVRFKSRTLNPVWVGTITAYVNDKQVECEGNGAVPVSMIELAPPDPSEGLMEVIALQAALIDEGAAYRARAVELLETYVMRQLGERRPLSIADVDLRDLVLHLRGGSL